MFFFDTAPVSQYVLNDGSDNKLNSMDSVLVDKCGDYVTSPSAHHYGLCETRSANVSMFRQPKQPS